MFTSKTKRKTIQGESGGKIKDLKEQIGGLKKQNSSLKGQVTKLKKSK